MKNIDAHTNTREALEAYRCWELARPEEERKRFPISFDTWLLSECRPGMSETARPAVGSGRWIPYCDSSAESLNDELHREKERILAYNNSLMKEAESELEKSRLSRARIFINLLRRKLGV